MRTGQKFVWPKQASWQEKKTSFSRMKKTVFPNCLTKLLSGVSSGLVWSLDGQYFLAVITS